MNLLRCYDDGTDLQENLLSLRHNKEMTRTTGLLLSKAVDYACLAVGCGKKSRSEFLLGKVLPSLPTFLGRCFAYAFEGDERQREKVREVYTPVGARERSELLLRLLDMGCLLIRHNSELGFTEYLFGTCIPRSFQMLLSWIAWSDDDGDDDASENSDEEEKNKKKKRKDKPKGKDVGKGKGLEARQAKQIQILSKVLFSLFLLLSLSLSLSDRKSTRLNSSHT